MKLDTAANFNFCSEVNDSILVEFSTLMHAVPDFLASPSLELDEFQMLFSSNSTAKDSRLSNDMN